MKKEILFLMVLFCLVLVSAEEGEYCYQQGSYYLSKGDIELARTNFECAVNSLYGEQQTLAQDVLDMVNSISSSSSRVQIIEGENWFFVGEIDNDDSSTHLYYDAQGNSVTHTYFDDPIDISEFMSSLEEITFTTRGAPGSTNWVEGYESEVYSPAAGISSFVFVWNCKNSGNIASITYSSEFDEYSLWDSIYVCPTSSFKWWYILVGIGLVILGYFGYMNRGLLFDKYQSQIRKMF